MAPPPKILIVGCSVAGPVLATCLLISDLPAAEKPQITILERAADVRTQGQNVDVRGAGVTIIRKLGIEGLIRASTTGEEGVQFVDEQNRVWAAFGADKTGKTSTPTADIEILRGRLAEICYQRSRTVSDEVQQQGGAGIEYIFGDYLDELEQNGDRVNVRFAKSGRRESYDIVVGADGLQSLTRRMTWGEEGEKERLKLLGMYGGYFSMTRGETDTLWRRWFHTTGRRAIMLRPDEQNGKTTAFLYVINEQDERLMDVAKAGRADVGAQKRLLQEYFQGAGWESERVLKEMLTTDDFYYNPVAQIKMDKWSTGRVVLVGDAGYCASPISGMGTTLAISGAYNLAGALLQNPNDMTAAFDEYETAMRPVVERAQKLAPGMPHLINPETTWGIQVMLWMCYLFWQSRIILLLFKFLGPPAHIVPVRDFGIRQLNEMTEAESRDSR